MVSMSYSQNFISETDANFTLYPQEGSPGTLHRSGQWQCNDGGPSDVCYEDAYACGRAPDWIEECVPCGLDTSADSERFCVPLTVNRAAEGHDKITKTKIKTVNYFASGSVSDIYGGEGSNNIHTASISSSNHPYYFSVLNDHPQSSSAAQQFSVSWGHIKGSGSYVNKDVYGAGNKGSSETVYKQYASLLLDDRDIEKGFLISSGSDVRADGVDGNIDEYIYVVSFKRNKFGDNLQPGTWTLRLSGSHGNTGKTIELTDNSQVLTSPTITTVANSQGDVARRYDIISGSAGNPYNDYSVVGERYGFFYPEAGLMVFGEKLGNDMSSGSMGNGDTNSPETTQYNVFRQGGYDQLNPSTGSSEDTNNALKFINCMKNVSVESGSALTIWGEKEVTEVIYICRIGPDEFNFTNNFSIITGSGRTMFNTNDTAVMNGFPTAMTSSAFTSSTAGAPSSIVYGDSIETQTYLEDDKTLFQWPGSNVPTMYGYPNTFITQVHLYDEHGECLAIANLSKPLRKNYEREAVIKVKLTF